MKSLLFLSSLALIATLGVSCDAKAEFTSKPAAPAAKAAPVTVKVETASSGTVAGQAFKSLPELQALVAKLDKNSVIRLTAAPEMIFTDLEPVMKLLKKQSFPSILLNISKVEVELAPRLNPGPPPAVLPPTCDVYVLANGYISRGQEYQSLNGLEPDLSHFAVNAEEIKGVKDVIVNVKPMGKASVKQTAALLDYVAEFKLTMINVFPGCGEDVPFPPPPPPPPSFDPTSPPESSSR